MLSVSSIEAKFKRAKLNVKNTFLWSELSEAEKNKCKIMTRGDEKNIIYYFRSESYYWIITNERLIILENNIQVNYQFKTIKEVNFPSIHEIERNKKGIDSITIVLDNGLSQSIYVENTSWHFIYELFKFLLAK